MSYSTHDIIAAVAIRINALVGTDPVELQVTYSTRPLTDELFQSSIFPFNAIRDSCVQAQGRLAQAIGLSGDRVLRAYLRGTSAALAPYAELPSADAAGTPFIGNFGGAFDADDNTPLTRMPVAVVRNRLLAPLLYLAPAYQFALTPDQFLHTRTTARLYGCVWDADAQTSIYNQDGDFTLADSLVEAVICGACAMLMRDDEWVEQSGRWATYFQTTLTSIPPALVEAEAA